MIASGDPPYFWAGFEVVGDPDRQTLFDQPNLNSTAEENPMNEAQSATLSADQRKKVLDRVLAALQKRFYAEPEKLNGDWQQAAVGSGIDH